MISAAVKSKLSEENQIWKALPFHIPFPGSEPCWARVPPRIWVPKPHSRRELGVLVLPSPWGTAGPGGRSWGCQTSGAQCPCWVGFQPAPAGRPCGSGTNRAGRRTGAWNSYILGCFKVIAL